MDLVSPDGSIFSTSFLPKFLRKSVKTLVMELIGPYGKSNPFSSQMSPEAGKPPVLPIIVFLTSFCQKISWTSVKTLAKESVGPNGQTGPFSRSNDPRSG
ncbi:hypothetical protein H5410_056454 [Solanum commersonii]|uniref:Uncharacterized protein n=1 Tax=Solanum commersonii TaxID=4109 RepID=A0A9J5WMR0_SOLCO|nr:hypothetical protein H5410_056454 [Solanum commersonii]